jgi:hypothetical protein
MSVRGGTAVRHRLDRQRLTNPMSRGHTLIEGSIKFQHAERWVGNASKRSGVGKIVRDGSPDVRQSNSLPSKSEISWLNG